MPKHKSKTSCSTPVSLLILEGDTEEVFYPIIKNIYLQEIRIELRNLKGQGNINNDVLSEIFKYTYNNRNDMIRAYCCVDTEGQNQSATPLELDFVREQIKCRKMTKVLSVNSILAVPEIESWFFYDIEGIYEFLKAPKSKRTIRKYSNPRALCKRDLIQLFSRFDSAYTPGKRASNFIAHLDIKKIVSNCKELREGIQLIKDQANDSSNHLFPNRHF